MHKKFTIAQAAMSAVIAAAAGALSGYLLFVRPRLKYWGATTDEIQRTLPGDEYLSTADIELTRAVTVKAKAAEIWPWLVQIGQGRGGYYTYTWLENLAKLNMVNADQLHAEWQQIKAGDIIPAEPGGSGFRVRAIEPEQALVLGGHEGEEGVTPGFTQMFPAFTWSFVLDEVDSEHTRLITRLRAQTRPGQSPMEKLLGFCVEPGEFLLTRGMLLGIKERAERTHKQAVAGEKVTIY
ncbi:MAG: SRPBCC family protein [Ktedonobacteraceae bacterium]|nr:SRPBCC family protein [Ktedonobacteraceae bacterium]